MVEFSTCHWSSHLVSFDSNGGGWGFGEDDVGSVSIQISDSTEWVNLQAIRFTQDLMLSCFVSHILHSALRFTNNTLQIVIHAFRFTICCRRSSGLVCRERLIRNWNSTTWVFCSGHVLACCDLCVLLLFWPCSGLFWCLCSFVLLTNIPRS